MYPRSDWTPSMMIIPCGNDKLCIVVFYISLKLWPPFNIRTITQKPMIFNHNHVVRVLLFFILRDNNVNNISTISARVKREPPSHKPTIPPKSAEMK